MHISLLTAAAASALILGASAQFQFFEQMFNGGQGQQQQQRDVGSDSVWYRDNYEAGEFAPNASPGVWRRADDEQRIAQTTSAPARCRASTSRTTARARSRTRRTRWS
jgi:hypothetical protein